MTTSNVGVRAFAVIYSEYKAAKATGKTIEVTRLENEIIKGEASLIDHCAKRCSTPGNYDSEDLHQAGCIGVYRALQKFDDTRGKWRPYAKQWVLAEMYRGVVDVRSQVPAAARWKEPLAKPVRRKAEAIEARTGRAATAQELGVSEADLDAHRARNKFETFDESRDGLSESDRPVLTATVLKALGSLSPLETSVLLGCLKDKSYVEIAEEEGLDKQYVRVVYFDAIAKIRQSLFISEKVAIDCT